MLTAIRSKASSWIVKILFVLLILSFAVWGISDFTQDGGAGSTVATVGDREITADALDTSFRNEVERFRQILGNDFNTRVALDQGFAEQALERLIREALLTETARSMDLAVPEPVVAQQVRQQAIFVDEVTGQFSRDRFLQILSANGLSEAGYVALLATSLQRDMVQSAVAGGSPAPSTLADRLYRFRNETRTISYAVFPPDQVTDVPAPTEPDLRRFYQENEARFTAPEYRRLGIASLRPEDLADEIAIEESLLREEYEIRAARYRQPEVRAFDQMVVQDQEQAARLADRARALGTLSDAAAELDFATPVVPIDPTTRADMFPDALADAGFALDSEAISAPVQSPFGWHVLQVTEVRQGVVTPFGEVRAEIRHDLALDRALDAIFEMANSFEDALAGGATIREAAETATFTYVETPPVSATGEPAPTHPPLPDTLPAPDQVLAEAFDLPAGGATQRLTETDGGAYFAVQVTEVSPPTLRPFDAVRESVEAAWRASQQDTAARATAERVADRLREGAAWPAAAETAGGIPGEVADLDRQGRNAGPLPPGLVDSLFQGTEGDVVVAVGPEGPVLARIDTIIVPDTAAAADTVASLSQQIGSQIAQDLMDQFLNAVQADIVVEIDDQAVASVFAGG